jgi:hypothetical protein
LTEKVALLKQKLLILEEMKEQSSDDEEIDF